VILYFAFSSLIIYAVRQKVISDQQEIQYQFSQGMSSLLSFEVKRNHQLLLSVADKYSGKSYEDLVPFEIISDNLFLTKIFNNGIFLFDIDGRLLYEAPSTTDRYQKNFAHRQYFQETIKQKRGIISKPYISSLYHKHPCVMFTAPVYNDHGSMIAIIGGSVDLLKPNFISEQFQLKHTDKSYYMLLNEDGQILYHPQNAWIYKKLATSDTQENLNRKDFDKESIITVSSRVIYPNWKLTYSVFETKIDQDMISNKRLIRISVLFCVLMFELMMLYVALKIWRMTQLLAKKLDQKILLRNEYEYIPEKGLFIVKTNIRKINELISLYRDLNVMYRRAISDSIYIFSHLEYAFVSFSQEDGYIKAFNQNFLELTDINEEEARTQTITEILFKTHELYRFSFEEYINNISEEHLSDKIYVFKKDNTPVRLVVHAYKIHFYKQEQIVLIMKEKIVQETYLKDFQMQKNLSRFLFENSNMNIHLTDKKGIILAYSPEFKALLAPDKLLKDRAIWDLLTVNMELIQLQQYFNSISKLSDEKTQYYINIMDSQTHLMDLYKLAYHIIWDENYNECLIVGIITKNRSSYK